MSNTIRIPARHITAGDKFYGGSVSQTRELPDGGREFRVVVPMTAHYQTITIREQDLDAVFYDVHTRGDSHSPNRRNALLGLPLEEPPVYVEPEPIQVYIAGTPVSEVRHWDRGRKASFHCKEHPSKTFVSKDPYVSSWFSEWGGQTCTCSLDNYVLAADYRPTRNG